MSRNLREQSAAAAPWLARQEREADSAAALPPHEAARPALTPTPAEAAAAPSAEAALGAGRPLPAASAEGFGARFGRDFSGVRVHADAEAAEAADLASARAFTRGNHIVFGAGQFQPHTAQGRQLLAHELAHVAQQSGAPEGAGVVQCDNQPGPKGIGSAPPSEPFETPAGKEVGEEDTRLLFENDSADLPKDAAKKLSGLIKDQTAPVTVYIHGYASVEGDETYNLNLSAHRAAAVKAALLPMLPPGSQVTLVAHGLTAAFGGKRDNRRAGIKVTQGVTPSAPKGEAGKEDWRLTLPQLSWPGPKPTLGLGLQYRPPTLAPPTLAPPVSLFPPSITLPPGSPITGGGTPPWAMLPSDLNAPPLGLMDWPSLSAPFRLRGLNISGRDGDSITQTWVSSFWMWYNLGLSREQAADIANLATSTSYNLYMAREFPTPFDKAQQEWDLYKKQYHPDEFSIPPLPVLSPTTLDLLQRKVFKIKKPIDFRF